MTAPTELFAIGIDGSRSVYVRNADGSWPTVPTRIEQPATSQEGEGKAETWLDKRVSPGDSRDRDYDADDMIDAFLAGIGSKSVGCRECQWSGLERFVGYGNSEETRPCSFCAAATPTPPTLSEDLGYPDALGSAAFELLALGYAKATAWHHHGIAWDHLERISQDELIEQARAALARAQVKAS